MVLSPFHVYNYIVLVQVQLRTEVLHTPNSTQQGFEPPDHDSTFHVTETPVLTTKPSVTSDTHKTLFTYRHAQYFSLLQNMIHIYKIGLLFTHRHYSIFELAVGLITFFSIWEMVSTDKFHFPHVWTLMKCTRQYANYDNDLAHLLIIL